MNPNKSSRYQDVGECASVGVRNTTLAGALGSPHPLSPLFTKLTPLYCILFRPSVRGGIMKPGLNAIMGPPGGGKSLLLGLLAARKKPRGLSGNVWVHGVPKCNSGYVVQDDVVMSTLSMRENIQFSASLRIPTTMQSRKKNNPISKVIEKLGLCEMADSEQGTCFVKSKGERKMVSIGMELILDPSILFLDEPTTGLDWNTAYKIIKLLKSISEQERTIIFSIHQPVYSIFNMFDSLTILASGKLMYHGPAQEALEYFKSAGNKRECYIIPEEFFLDIITGIIKRESEDHEANNTEMPLDNEESVIEALADFYTKSPICGETKSELQGLSKDQNKRCLFREEITYVTSFGHQLIGITWRSFQSLVPHPQPWIVQPRRSSRNQQLENISPPALPQPMGTLWESPGDLNWNSSRTRWHHLSTTTSGKNAMCHPDSAVALNKYTHRLSKSCQEAFRNIENLSSIAIKK
ncbi:LOW QUALITY PROTEIN: broad substrate specificity ATP-binding cassette transporter ABCG2-like [Marmota flaviventris]|uniref:LOW QUALITY PROTEIN: broad substrate specificity ATP-binding cassette transporter ABCG2-like n=1 Tax=Marmota flaviventris TaxID=93162 RepID=UPI003A85CC75